MTLADVKRNDIDAAAKYYESRGNRISSDEYRVLLKLQDEPSKFIQRSTAWTVVEPEERT